MRVVLDTPVFVRALLNRYSRCGRIVFEHGDKFQLIFSRETVAEAIAVIQRPSIQANIPPHARPNLKRVLDILTNADMLDVAHVKPVSRDPNDDIFIALAFAGNAEYIVTEDKDLLVLNPLDHLQIVNTEHFVRLFEVTDL
ncbi:MAG: putative toxin-antitoxin system toxin component, PIN family [Anaerolineae bacterium]|nr:putative toxin-antitoxin system toxin component, PIN family [Anaerolineae bacterium]